MLLRNVCRSLRYYPEEGARWAIMDPLYLAGCAWHIVVSDRSHFSVHFNNDIHVFSLTWNDSVRLLYV